MAIALILLFRALPAVLSCLALTGASVSLFAPSAAQAGSQLFEGSWTVKAMGNELTGGSGESAAYSAIGIPQGIQCNSTQPRCPISSTPTDGLGQFHRLGGFPSGGPYCLNLTAYGSGNTVRPAKGATPKTSPFGDPIPPLYRNPNFFTPGGQPGTTLCTATSTGATPGGKGLVQVGRPITGTWSAATTPNGAFNFAAAPVNGAAGIRVGQGTRIRTASGMYSQGSAMSGLVGDLPISDRWIYRYTYATLRNDLGAFGPGQGPGSFNLSYTMGNLKPTPDGKGDAQIYVKAGAAKFGGTMRMLGALTSKACFFVSSAPQTHCQLGENNWRYDAIGASAFYTTTPNNPSGTMIASGYKVTYRAYYTDTYLSLYKTVDVEGARFPWTTGRVTVKAAGRGPRKTVHYAQGYDNRTLTPNGGQKGMIQLVTPVLTRWKASGSGSVEEIDTGGVGILRIEFSPPLTPTPTPTATPTPTPSSTPPPSATPTATPSPTATPPPSATPTATPSPTATPPPSATPTATPSSTATPPPSASPTATPTATPGDYILGGPAASLTPGSGNWSWDGGIHFTDYRAAIEDSANFGPAGTVPQSITTADLSSVTAGTLASLDGFISPYWNDSETTAARATAVVDFFLAGGDLILLQDNASHDAIGAQLGIDTSSPGDGSASNGGAPLFDGPFGSASDVAHFGQIGQLSATDVSSNGGTVGATNASGEITAAYWDAGDYAPGAGRLLILSDTDMWAATNATYVPLNDNGIFALNGTRFAVVPEPGALLQLGSGIGLLALLARRRNFGG